MASTTTHGLPYPNNADVPNIAGDIQALAEAVDTNTGSHGKSIIAAAGTRLNTAYGQLSNGPDQVAGVLLPADGLIVVSFSALWKKTAGASSTLAALFLNSNQVKIGKVDNAPVVTEALRSADAFYAPLVSSPNGLTDGGSATADAANVTTGQLVAFVDAAGANPKGGLAVIEAAAGTYTVSVQFKTGASETVTVKERKLRVWTQPV